ncbi:MAG TPA: hypothetical protein VHT91_17820 [Kofleriaceae bacterium]|nr:hypothetical protein [Kofleriaceae bacterium]
MVGNHLLRVEVDGRATTVEDELARQLAAELGIAGPTESDPRLSEVAFVTSRWVCSNTLTSLQNPT